MTAPREGHTAALLNDGTVLITGGNSGCAIGVPVYFASTELYTPLCWRTAPQTIH